MSPLPSWCTPENSLLSLRVDGWFQEGTELNTKSNPLMRTGTYSRISPGSSAGSAQLHTLTPATPSAQLYTLPPPQARTLENKQVTAHVLHPKCPENCLFNLIKFL